MGIIKKAEELLSGNHKSSSTTNSTANNGPHNSTLANKLDPRVDATQASSTHAHPPGGTTGPHDSNMANKLDPRVNSNATNRVPAQNITPSTGPASTTAGPHHSNMGNKVDPFIDSDLDNSARVGGHSHGAGVHREPALGGPGSSKWNHGPAPNTAGPHKSDMANKLDPRVDSDLDSHGAAHGANSLNTGPASTTAGPHSSNLANKADPRIDSDMDNRAHHQATAGSSYGNPTVGGAPGLTYHNPAHKVADPRVDAVHENRVSGTGNQRFF
ncbi:hypothetical protein N7540_001376 [Penicillium herquei]|nr:hypothetical protein N7540_001376 [Penicillium herquei]